MDEIRTKQARTVDFEAYSNSVGKLDVSVIDRRPVWARRYFGVALCRVKCRRMA